MIEDSRSERMQQIVTGALGHFPVGAATEFEGSTITIPVAVQLENGWITEEQIDFKAFMRLELDRRVRSQANRMQFEFNIVVWELYGQSKALSEKFKNDVQITFSLTPPPQKQPRSIVFSNQEGPDYPATVIYSACYDVFMNQAKIVDAQMGIALCTPVVSIPPRNVLVAFEKPFEDKERGIAFRRGCCWGMRTITPEEFLEGCNLARRIRGWPALRDPFGDFSGRNPGRNPGGDPDVKRPRRGNRG